MYSTIRSLLREIYGLVFLGCGISGLVATNYDRVPVYRDT